MTYTQEDFVDTFANKAIKTVLDRDGNFKGAYKRPDLVDTKGSSGSAEVFEIKTVLGQRSV